MRLDDTGAHGYDPAMQHAAVIYVRVSTEDQVENTSLGTPKGGRLEHSSGVLCAGQADDGGSSMTVRTDGQCHLCDDKERVEAGAYSDREFDKTPCAACMGADYKQFPHRGVSVVSLDEAPPHVGATRRDRMDQPEVVGDLTVSRFADFFREFMQLPPETRDVIGMRFLDLCGERHTYRSIGEDLGVSDRAVEARHRKALERIPALKTLFRGKDAKRIRRVLGGN